MSLVLLALLFTCLALAWGPGHHLEFSERVHRRRREHLPRDVAQLLGEERDAYFYGSIAADIINFKAYGGDYNHCHRWSIVEAMRALAESPREEAFILGYLSHLAADTIAHNHFVPYHLCRYARTKGLGHLYWEMNADRFVPEARWKVINHLKSLPELGELDELVNRTVPKKALSMSTNKLIFNHVLLVSERDAWRRGMERIHPTQRVRLEKGFLQVFQRAAVERVRLALKPRGFRAIQCVDPNGKVAQKQAVSLRRRIVSRWAAGERRQEQAVKLAAPFLEGMESPPPAEQG
ncbi:MAG: zinc dependent phospholipase C family protein [Planctomycetes bacterium]|nr:zinc dependent phospholipase C family protein [Planctomycetota bacterium]